MYVPRLKNILLLSGFSHPLSANTRSTAINTEIMSLHMGNIWRTLRVRNGNLLLTEKNAKVSKSSIGILKAVVRSSRESFSAINFAV